MCFVRDISTVVAFSQENQTRFIEELSEWLRIPSISTDPQYVKDVENAANWLANHLRMVGISEVRVIKTKGHPLVYAEYVTDSTKPTVLVYGHYDVQPPDPIGLWKTPPFEPTIIDNNIFARGSCDDKGQVFMHVKAIESYLKTSGSLPVNVKFLIEGEEEAGGESIAAFIEVNKELLKADVVLVSDTPLLAPGIPSITYGLRGIAHIEVILTAASFDLHSGVYGGAVENPVHVLSRMIAGLHDENNKITVEGFYDSVRNLTNEERIAYRETPFNQTQWCKDIGVTNLRTENGYSVLESTTGRPALDVNGIWGGYIGKGTKTILPAIAGAKISCRLVPNQEPTDIQLKLKRYFENNVPPTMNIECKLHHGGCGVIVDTKIPAMQAAKTALYKVFGKEPYFIRDGGSIPIVARFKQVLGLDTVLMGFGLDTDNLHSPNEKFGLDRFYQGIEASIHFLNAYSS